MRVTLDYWDYALVTLVGLYAISAPYSKVEESFNLQAIHDLLYYGADVEKYDHLEFPGVVPRTFIGAIAIAAITKPAQLWFKFSSKLDLQIICRGMLGVLNSYTYIWLRHTVMDTVKHGRIIGAWMSLFAICQFHFLFYSSRTLPNSFALIPVTLAVAWTLRERYYAVIWLLAFTSTVFRSELALLTASMALLFLVTKKQSVSNTIMSGLYGFGWGVILCAGVDSYFWLKFPMLPEYVGFLFNVVYGNSSAWGEEPWYAYFVRHLPNITNNPAVLVLFPVGLFSSGTGGPVQILGLAATVYVGLYSCLAHKEWRFVIYILPILNLVAASGAASLQTAIRHQTDGAKKKVTFAENNDDDIDSQVKSSNKPTTSQRKSAAAGDDVDPAGEAFLRQVRRFSYTAILAAVVLSSLGGFAVSTVKLAASTHNYPGGNALAAFHKFVDLDATREPVVVHLDVTTCMTGASRFGQLYDETSTHVPRVIYDKTEDYNKLLEVWPTFDYVIGIATPDRLPSVDGFKWHKIHSEPQFSRINLAYVRDLLSPANLISQVKALSGKSAVEELVKSVWSNVFITEEAVYIYKKVPAAV